LSSCTRDRFVVMYYRTSCVVIEILHNIFLPERNCEFLDDQIALMSRFVMSKVPRIQKKLEFSSKLRDALSHAGFQVALIICWGEEPTKVFRLSSALRTCVLVIVPFFQATAAVPSIPAANPYIESTVRRLLTETILQTLLATTRQLTILPPISHAVATQISIDHLALAF